MHEWSVMDFAGFAYEWCVFTLYIQGYQRIFARFLLLNCLQAWWVGGYRCRRMAIKRQILVFCHFQKLEALDLSLWLSAHIR